jgi:alkylation response protein AidB-like acyl-CoA dehydrogenase
MMMWDFGTEAQKAEFLPGLITGEKRMGFGLTEPGHGSDTTYMEASGRRDGEEWVIDGAKRFNSGLHDATHDLVFARTSGDQGAPRGITAFIVPTATPGFEVVEMDWTFNMPSDHALVRLEGVRIPVAAVLGEVDDGLIVAQHFLHENRIRQAASSLGAAQFCIDRSVDYAKQRTTWGKPLAVNQAIQFPLAELHTEAEMVRNLVYRTAWELDRQNHMAVTEQVAMANYRANRLVCQAADRAIQVHGGVGYTRNQPFEHIYRHHRRYRITEGAEEIQIRKIAANLFGFGRRNR